MPCYDDRSSASYISSEYQQKLDRLTRVACDLAKAVRSAEPKQYPLAADTVAWIQEHDELDRRREAEKDPNYLRVVSALQRPFRS